MRHTRSRKLRTLVATLVVAAVTAPVTQAVVDSGSVRGTPIPQAVFNSGSVRGTPVPWGATHARHQTLVGSHDQILLRHEAAGKLVSSSRSSLVTSGGGTDWGDAGLGAATGLVLILLGSGALLVSRRKLASA